MKITYEGLRDHPSETAADELGHDIAALALGEKYVLEKFVKIKF